MLDVRTTDPIYFYNSDFHETLAWARVTKDISKLILKNQNKLKKRKTNKQTKNCEWNVHLNLDHVVLLDPLSFKVKIVPCVYCLFPYI